MSRLAIVIPAVSGVESLEATLISVLENRPAASEVIVAANFAYEDPYDLADEVCFMAAPGRSGFVGCANLAIGAAHAPLVHVLAAGCTVSEGWADAALKHFDDPRVAAVAPLVRDAQRSDHVLAIGVDYSVGGARRQPRQRLDRASAAGAKAVFGACGFAGFFRKSALDAVGGWSNQTGATLADVELAWSLQRSGYRAICEPAAQVYASRVPIPREGALRQGFYAERLFWRNAGSVGWIKSLAMHPFTVAADTLASLTSPAVVLRLVGRLWACCQTGYYVRHYQELRHGMDPADVVPIEPPAGRLRVDGGHGAAGPQRSKRAASRLERCTLASSVLSPDPRHRVAPNGWAFKRTCHARRVPSGAGAARSTSERGTFFFNSPGKFARFARAAACPSE